ncbi:MAG: ribosomal protein S18-alanine N-acetyltransferase [Candidatus Baltobacteraceae bacterium]
MRAELGPLSSECPQRLQVEPMIAADIRVVGRIETLSFSTSWPQNAFVSEINDNKLAHYFVGRLDGEIVAYGGIWVILEDSHITTIAVHPSRRGNRYGEQMLARMLNEAIERGASWITLEVRESNEVAQNLYRKYGFTVVSTRRAYYSDNGENALVMWAGNLRGELYRNRLAALETRLEAMLQGGGL